MKTIATQQAWPHVDIAQAVDLTGSSVKMILYFIRDISMTHIELHGKQAAAILRQHRDQHGLNRGPPIGWQWPTRIPCQQQI